MTYTWHKAAGFDVESIVNLAQTNFESEIDTIFTPEPTTYSRNITLAVVNSFFSPNTELLSVAKDNNNKLIAYTWATGTERAPWSDDKMVLVKMAHTDLTLPSITRVKLVKDMLNIWETFAYVSNINIVCSTTMRKDQDTFLKLHKKYGYDVRGSYAYKRLNTTQATPAN